MHAEIDTLIIDLPDDHRCTVQHYELRSAEITLCIKHPNSTGTGGSPSFWLTVTKKQEEIQIQVMPEGDGEALNATFAMPQGQPIEGDYILRLGYWDDAAQNWVDVKKSRPA